MPTSKKALALATLFALGLAGCGTPTPGHPSTWPERARARLAELRDTLLAQHPGAGPKPDPDFMRTLEANYADALSRAASVTDEPGLYFWLRRFTNGFADRHLTLGYASLDVMSRKLPARWPGFFVGLRAGTWQVLAGGHKGPEYPRPGSVVESCDGREIERVIRETALDYFGNPAVPAERLIFGPRAFLDLGNPWTPRPVRCTFRVAGVPRDLDLRWEDRPLAELWVGVRNAAFGPAPPFELRRLRGHGLWLALPSFAPDAMEAAHLLDLLSRLKREVPKARYLVFDLRGNTGGDSRWAMRALAAGLGDDGAERAFADYDRKHPEAYVYRATSENLGELRDALLRQRRVFGESPFFSRVVPGFADAVRAGDAYFRFTPGPERLASAATEAPGARTRAPRVFAVTDSWCFSACLSFLDWFKEVPDALQAGLPTDADTLYNHLRDVPLGDDGALVLSMPILRIENRRRKSNEAYVPELPPNADTQALEKFLFSFLAKPENARR